MAEVAILIPMWLRAHRAAKVAASALTTPDARVVFVCSLDDEPTHHACRTVESLEPDRVEVIAVSWPGGSPGDYARKINAAAVATSEPLLFTGADDLDFHHDWLDHCKRQLHRRGIGVVGTNDLGNRRTVLGRHSTHTLVTRWYVEQFGTIDQPGLVLHEGYWHEYVDDELVHTAMHRGAWAHARRAKVEHLHPHWSKAPTDATYDAQPERMAQGRELFLERQPLWGGSVRR